MTQTPKELARTFESDVFERYVTHFVGLLKQSLGKQGGVTQALDLGCGTGSITLRIAELMPAGSRIIAVSESREEINELHRRTSDLGEVQLFPRKESFARLPFAPATFDLIWCCAPVHPLGPPKPLLRVAHELLRPGGLLAFCTPLAGSFMELTGAMTPLAENEQQGLTVQQFLATRPELPSPESAVGLFQELGFIETKLSELQLEIPTLPPLPEDRLFGLHLLPLWLGRAATDPNVLPLLERAQGISSVSLQVGCVVGRKGLATS